MPTPEPLKRNDYKLLAKQYIHLMMARGGLANLKNSMTHRNDHVISDHVYDQLSEYDGPASRGTRNELNKETGEKDFYVVINKNKEYVSELVYAARRGNLDRDKCVKLCASVRDIVIGLKEVRTTRRVKQIFCTEVSNSIGLLTENDTELQERLRTGGFRDNTMTAESDGSQRCWTGLTNLEGPEDDGVPF